MSAVFGALRLDGEPVPREWLERLLAPLARLGPDRQGLHCIGNAGLGHCLLATTPESEGERQPLRGENGRVAVVLAGTLFERHDLGAALGVPARDLDRTPDSALALRAYERWGEGCLDRLAGEFVLAVADAHRGELLLAQSRVAAFPLYLVRTPRLFAFATRTVPLLSLPGVEKELDPAGFVRAVGDFGWRAAAPHETCFRGIECLTAATALRVGPGVWRRWRYWEPDPERVTPFASEAEVHETVRDRMRRAVRERIRGRHPVACLLSGGLDSSALACLAAAELLPGRPLVGIASVLPPGAGPADGTADAPDERPFVEVVRRHLGIPVEYVSPPLDLSPWEFPPSLFAETETPRLSPRHYLYEALFAAAHRHGARVLLDGIGGEAGPSARDDHHERELFVRGRWPALVRELRAAARSEETSWARAARRRVVAPLLLPALHRARPGRPATPVTTGLYAALDPEFLRMAQVRQIEGSPRRPEPGPGGERRVDAAHTWQLWGQPWVVGPGFPIAWQAPLRDLDLWEYCRGLPLRLTRHDGWKRYLIRAAMEGILPEEIRWRTSKAPFSPDYYSRLRRTLPQARALCEAVPRDGLAARALDLGWLRRALAACEERPARLTLEMAFACQGTLAAAQFLDWFERLPAPAPPLTRL